MATQPQNWERIKALFQDALELNPRARSAFLLDNCPDDEVRGEVERLLAEHDQAGGFLSTPALGDFPIEAETPTQKLLEGGELLAGRFRIVRFIASGGMGAVYEAEDQELRERVAVKIIRPEILAQPNAVVRFRREVHLARKVTHPNVCRIFDLFRHRPQSGNVQEETVFLSMELLNGKTLEQQFNVGGPFDVSNALPLVRQMASALAAAHAEGIVHRDFKPGNVLLVAGSVTKWRAVVTDFGLAYRPLISETSASFSTGPGLLGTPAYMSPEQLVGRPAEPSSDIYALGLVIYEMVTGAKPFKGDTPISAALKRLTETPIPPRKFKPDLSPMWESVILRCLEQDPARRFASAELVAEALVDVESAVELRKDAPRRKTAADTVAEGKLRKIAVVALAMLLVAGVAGELYYYSHLNKPLTAKDTIVLADFSNSTGDPVFDDTLKTALIISLEQSPLLNVLSQSNVAATLRLMTRPRDTKLTPEVAREVCQRAGSKAYIAGSIASLGSEYVLGLKVVDCQTGDTLVQEQATAAGKEKVLNAFGDAASKLRGELGESLTSVQKLDVPLAQATTSSLEALQAYSLGEKAFGANGHSAALPHHQDAIELDPNFAMAYEAVGVDYHSLGELGRAREYYTKAFQLRDHASEREKLVISAEYYRVVTGERGKAVQIFQEWIANYPRDYLPHLRLCIVYAEEGQYEKATEFARESLRLAPNTGGPYANLTNRLLALQRFDEAGQTIQQAQTRKLDTYVLHNALYALAFIRHNPSAMAEQQQWFAGKLEENFGLSLASDSEAFAGHLRKAQEFTRRSVDSAIRADRKESGAIWLENSALREAAFGNLNNAKWAAAKGLKLMSTSQGVRVEAALAYAMIGDSARAESVAQDLSKHYPLDTQVQSLWLPAIHAQLALKRKNPADALKSLQAGSAIEFGTIVFGANLSCLYPTYNRGEAYLAAGRGTQAAVEFQKILDHSGIVWNCWTGALAHLGVARANVLQSRTSQGADADAARVRALAAYKDFLTLWKDADPDIPILKRAKAEYAKLQ